MSENASLVSRLNHFTTQFPQAHHEKSIGETLSDRCLLLSDVIAGVVKEKIFCAGEGAYTPHSLNWSKRAYAFWLIVDAIFFPVLLPLGIVVRLAFARTRNQDSCIDEEYEDFEDGLSDLQDLFDASKGLQEKYGQKLLLGWLETNKQVTDEFAATAQQCFEGRGMELIEFWKEVIKVVPDVVIPPGVSGLNADQIAKLGETRASYQALLYALHEGQGEEAVHIFCEKQGVLTSITANLDEAVKDAFQRGVEKIRENIDRQVETSAQGAIPLLEKLQAFMQSFEELEHGEKYISFNAREEAERAYRRAIVCIAFEDEANIETNKEKARALVENFFSGSAKARELAQLDNAETLLDIDRTRREIIVGLQKALQRGEEYLSSLDKGMRAEIIAFGRNITFHHSRFGASVGVLFDGSTLAHQTSEYIDEYMQVVERVEHDSAHFAHVIEEGEGKSGNPLMKAQTLYLWNELMAEALGEEHAYYSIPNEQYDSLMGQGASPHAYQHAYALLILSLAKRFKEQEKARIRKETVGGVALEGIELCLSIPRMCKMIVENPRYVEAFASPQNLDYVMALFDHVEMELGVASSSLEPFNNFVRAVKEWWISEKRFLEKIPGVIQRLECVQKILNEGDAKEAAQLGIISDKVRQIGDQRKIVEIIESEIHALRQYILLSQKMMPEDIDSLTDDQTPTQKASYAIRQLKNMIPYLPQVRALGAIAVGHADLFKALADKSACEFSASSSLMEIIQRVMRYPSLLENMMKNLDKVIKSKASSPDFCRELSTRLKELKATYASNLETAEKQKNTLDLIQDVAKALNSRVNCYEIDGNLNRGLLILAYSQSIQAMEERFSTLDTKQQLLLINQVIETMEVLQEETLFNLGKSLKERRRLYEDALMQVPSEEEFTKHDWLKKTPFWHAYEALHLLYILTTYEAKKTDKKE